MLNIVAKSGNLRIWFVPVFGEKVQIIFNKKDVKDKRSSPKNVKILGETSEKFCKILKILERSFGRL